MRVGIPTVLLVMFVLSLFMAGFLFGRNRRKKVEWLQMPYKGYSHSDGYYIVDLYQSGATAQEIESELQAADLRQGVTFSVGREYVIFSYRSDRLKRYDAKLWKIWHSVRNEISIRHRDD